MKTLKQDKGVGGLVIFLSLITMLFTIGLLVMIFVFMGDSLANSSSAYTTSGTISVTNETISNVNTTRDFAVYSFRNAVCSLSNVYNATDGAVINSGNYTNTNCQIANATSQFGGYNWNVTYTYTYSVPTAAVSVIDNTTAALSSAISWFPLFIIMGAMVVLVLLLVIIIAAIRGTGFMGGGESQSKGGNIGTA